MPQMRAADDKSMGTASCPEAVPKFNGVRDPRSVFRRRFSLLLNYFSARIIPQIACGHDRFVPVCGHEKKTSLQACLFCTITLRSDGALNLVGAEASRTDVNMAGSAVNDSLDALHVRLPRTVGTSVGVRNLDAKRDTLAAKIALCQLLHLQSSQNHALDRAKRRLYIIAKKSQECKGKIEKMQKKFSFWRFSRICSKKSAKTVAKPTEKRYNNDIISGPVRPVQEDRSHAHEFLQRSAEAGRGGI